jgi:Kef-type K+ transport system membrane component KefB
MRHLVQFIVPVLIFVGVVYLLGRRRRAEVAHRADDRPPRESDTAAFLVILSLGAAVAIVAFLALQSWIG